MQIYWEFTQTSTQHKGADYQYTDYETKSSTISLLISQQYETTIRVSIFICDSEPLSADNVFRTRR